MTEIPAEAAQKRTRRTRKPSRSYLQTSLDQAGINRLGRRVCSFLQCEEEGGESLPRHQGRKM